MASEDDRRHESPGAALIKALNHWQRGRELSDGAPRDAIEEFRAAISAAPSYPPPYFDLARLLAEQAAAENLPPPPWGPPSKRGELRAEAISTLERFLTLEPGSPNGHHLMGRLLGDVKRFAESEQELRKAMELAPGAALLFHDLGVLMEYQQKWEAAEESLREAIKRDPQNQEFRSALRRMRITEDCSGLDDWIRPRLSFESGVVATERYGEDAVPVLHVADASDYEKITTALASMSTRRYQTLFRGQQRSWTRDGALSLSPALLRMTHAGTDIVRHIGEWRRLLRPFMGDLADDHRPAFTIGRSDIGPRGAIYPPGIADAGRMVDLVWQPEMGGTMQHYGFPTDFLDVTPHPGVALWFALHYTRLANGYTEFERTAWSSAEADDQWPVVYVFNAFRRHVVDLRDGCLSQTTALRIHRQHASLLTTVEFALPTMNPNMPRRLAAAIPPHVTEVRPNLVLVLKLRPDESWERSAPEKSAWYFPRDDEIYRGLVDGEAPHVARYSV